MPFKYTKLKLQLNSYFFKVVEIAHVGCYNVHVTIKCENIFIAFHTSSRVKKAWRYTACFDV